MCLFNSFLILYKLRSPAAHRLRTSVWSPSPPLFPFMIFTAFSLQFPLSSIHISDLLSCPTHFRFRLLFTFFSFSPSASCSSSWQISPFSPPSVSLSDHIFEQVVINDIQRLMNYSPKRDRNYRERKKENSKREDERGGRRGVRWRGRKEEEAKETNDEGGVRWGWKAWCLSCNASEEIVCVEMKSKFHNCLLIVWRQAYSNRAKQKKKVFFTLDMFLNAKDSS